jgi:integrase
MPREALVASIRERVWTGADGTQRRAWQVDFIDQSGKRRHKQFVRRKDADAWLVQARGQVQAGTFSPDSTSITVAEAAALWLQQCERDGLEWATLTQYRSHVQHHIGPLLGSVKLSRLTRPAVEQFADDLLAGNRSRPLAKKVLTSLKAVIKEATRRGLAAQNVASGIAVKVAERHRRKVEIPSPEEMKALIDGATGRDRTILILAALVGLRASEIRGLRWADVDFAQRLIQVRQRADTSGKIGSLKSVSARRDIQMAPLVVNTLREWKLASGGGELVFPGRRGGVTCHTVLREAHGRMHRFRHFFASWLIDQGFGPKRVQALMGHSSIAITFDVYGHLFPQEDDHERFAAGELALIG